MKNHSVLLVAVVVSAAVSAITSGLLTPDVASGDEGRAGEDAPLLELSRTLAALEAGQRELVRELDELRMRPTNGVADGRLAVGEIEAIVSEYLAENAPLAAALPMEDPAAIRTGDLSTMPLEDILELLTSEQLTGDEFMSLMSQLSKAGRMDEIVAAAEQMTKDDPNNPDAHVFLGSAYLNKIFEVGQGPEAGKWAMLADGSFDAALALDENHWDARFAKAVSLSNWPAFLGKSGEAIHQFEILIEKQADMPTSSSHAETFHILGNMYQQTGNASKAIETWERGLALFPDHTELLRQLDLARQNG